MSFVQRRGRRLVEANVIDGNAPAITTPRMTRALFTDVLTNVGSPWAAAAPALYDLIVGQGHDPAFWLAIAGRETTFGTNLDSVYGRNHTNSWTNARSVRLPGLVRVPWKDAQGNVLPVPTGTYQIITDPIRKSQYVRYCGVADSLLDGMYRLTDPAFAYQKANAVSIAQVLAIWTESESAEYTAYVVNKISEWSAAMPTPQRPPHIALSAGHRNTSGGDAHETQQTAVITPASAAACRALGMDVRVVQGRDGADMFPGNLHAVAQTVAGWDAAGWSVDIYLEVHTEGAGGARGMFAIYPDWNDDVDADVRDKLGPDIVARVTKATGLGKRGSGLMSEKQTGVGAGGDRLGIFAYTASIKDHATRLIVEFGAHDNPADLAIVDAPEFAGNAGVAVAQAFAVFLGWQSSTSGDGSTHPAPDMTPSTNDALYLPGNPFGHIAIVRGFRGYLERLAQARYPQDTNAAILSIVGYPKAAEYAIAGGSAQEFERAVLLWLRDANAPFDIVLLRRDDAIPEAA